MPGCRLVAGDTANLCLIVQREALAAMGGDWDGLLAALLRDPAFAARLGRAEPLFARPLAIANLPYGRVLRRAPDDVFRLGDQAAMTASVTGDGMAGALLSAPARGGCDPRGRERRRLPAPLRPRGRLASPPGDAAAARARTAAGAAHRNGGAASATGPARDPGWIDPPSRLARRRGGSMRLSRAPILLSALVAIAPLPAQAAAPIFGLWMTDNRSAVIRIAPCGRLLCGTIERVLDPKAPADDINAPDPAHRQHALVGTQVLTGFTGAGAEWSGGTAYDPRAGRSYRSRLRLESADRLRLTGCLLFICRTLIWTRVS